MRNAPPSTLHGAIKLFAEHLAPGAKILCAGEPLAAEAFLECGFDARQESRDLRLLSLSKESWEGVWCFGVTDSYPAEQLQRVLLTFFAALKPGRGLLLLTQPPAMTDSAIGALLRQSGFDLLLRGTPQRQEGPGNPEQRIALLCRRV